MSWPSPLPRAGPSTPLRHWEPETEELWGLNHGIDWLRDNEQEEELNHLVEGKKYG
jgi:glucose/arabinose dehydrogenase